MDGAANNVDKPEDTTGKVIEFGLSDEAIEGQLEDWIERILRSNEELVIALERLRSACQFFQDLSSEEAQELLAQVEMALSNAAKAKSVL